MPTQQSRSDATRELLLKAFRQSLLEHGLEATTTASVLTQTGLSKGALYHHFSSKAEIIAAIYRAESHDAIMRALDRAGTIAGPLDRLKRACEGWLVEVRKPAVARILFQIGPAAIGVDAAKRIENEFSLALFERLLGEVDQSGEIAIANPKVAARLLNAMMAELAVGGLANPDEAVTKVGPLIEAVLAAFNAPG